MARSRQKIENPILFYETYFFDSESNTVFGAVLLTIGTPITIIFPMFTDKY